MLPALPKSDWPDKIDNDVPAPRRPSPSWHRSLGSRVYTIAKYITYIVPVIPLLASIIPVALLIALAPTLSARLGHSGCTPSGDFVIPYSQSVWNIKHFFTITITFIPEGWGVCSGGGARSLSAGQQTGSERLNCKGYSFTHAKMIDVAWDVLMGRGGQIVLITFAYRLFSRVIKMLMQHGEVGYDIFGAIAFNSGTLYSVLVVIRQLVGAGIPRTPHASLAYAGMAGATLYIIAMPSLFAAMTGYTSHFAPFLDYTDLTNSSLGLVDCFGVILPVWGRVQPLTSVTESLASFNTYEVWDSDTTPYEYIISEGFPILTSTGGPTWIEPHSLTSVSVDYKEHRSVYEACPRELSISACPEANRETYLLQPWEADWTSQNNITIRPPMPGILPLQGVDTEPSQCTHWLCRDHVISTTDLDKFDKNGFSIGAATRLCRAGLGYAWGFSFLFTFTVCILNLSFVLIMYALWIDVSWRANTTQRSSEFRDAAILISSAERQYGSDISEWSSKDLKKVVREGRICRAATVARVEPRAQEGPPVLPHLSH